MRARNWMGSVAPVLALGLALAACNQVKDFVSGKKSEADIKLTEYPEQVYFGDTHLHTSNSSDAFGLGVRLGPEEALRFARGEEVTSSTGLKAQLARPLDFLVISDHADWDELTATVQEANPAETWITHGREEALLRWCELNQRRARALALVGYEDEDD